MSRAFRAAAAHLTALVAGFALALGWVQELLASPLLLLPRSRMVRS